jgi:hypothetical protein
VIALLLALLAGCGPDPCPAMCEEAATRYQACLAADGLDWEAAGYAGRDDFADACATWAWEQRLLAHDVGEPASDVDALCEDYREVAVIGTCEDFESLDW